MTASAAEILFSVRGPLGLVTLNRPQALNALTIGMYRAFDRQLALWQRDPAIKAVVVRGAGRAFCAGGDVVHVAESGLAARTGTGDGGALARDGFFAEYRLDRRIATLGKPYFALLDGFTLGGGAGISLHGSHPVATEHTRFAMPECVIGLFPDIGASHFFTRCPGHLGMWLGLTGARLAAADLIYTGLVRHYVPQARLEALVADLEAADWSGPGAAVADAVIARHAESAGEPALAAHREMIDRCFGCETVEGMVAALEQEPGEFARVQLEALRRGSPTSLKVTLRQLREGAALGLDECLRLDYRLSQAFMEEHDFYEGIRAALVDKDKNPRWFPPTLAGVGDELVDRHFRFRPPREQSFDEE